MGKPTEDSFDWGTQANANFQVINDTIAVLGVATTTLAASSASGLTAVGASTQTIQNNVGASTAAITAILTTVGASTQTNAGLIGMATGQILAEATTYVNVIGDRMTGPLELTGSTLTVGGNAFSVGGSTWVISGGSATLAYQLTVGSILMSGATAYIQNNSSITGSAFFGDGSHLTGLTGVQTNTSNNFNTAATNQTFGSSVTVNGRLDLGGNVQATAFIETSASSTTNKAPITISKETVLSAATWFTGAATQGGVTTNYAVNVTSITRVATGKYRINFTNSMASTNYVCSCLAFDNASVTTLFCQVNNDTAAGRVPHVLGVDFDFRTTANAFTDPTPGAYVMCFGGG